MDKIFLIKTISLYLAIISLISTVVFLVLNFVKAEKVKVNLNKANKKEVLKLDDEDWTKSILQTDENLSAKSPKNEKNEFKKDSQVKPKSDKFELKDL
ncbi:MAG: hypothetical protein N2485_00560 [bacterium]|nr:hypothetical protein [bacterium]